MATSCEAKAETVEKWHMTYRLSCRYARIRIAPGPILRVPNVSANALNALTGSKRNFGARTALVGVVAGDCSQPPFETVEPGDAFYTKTDALCDGLDGLDTCLIQTDAMLELAWSSQPATSHSHSSHREKK